MATVSGMLPAAHSRRAITGKLWLAVLAPIVAVGVLWLPSHALASGDVIRVVSDERTVNFPGNVAFDLKLEGQDQIVEVTLHYRVVPSQIWSFTHLDFVPSQNVETTAKIQTSGATYLPPGVQVEYYYTVLDSQGNTLDTDPERFQYLDDRFDWRSRQAGPINLLHHNLDEGRVGRVTKQVADSLEDLQALLQVNLAEGATGVIYNSSFDSSEAFPYQSDSATQEPLFRGFAFPEQAVFVGVGYDAGLIIHESAHLLLDAALDSARGGALPAWINEGFATYVGRGGGPSRPFISPGTDPNMIRLRHMRAVPGRPESIGFFYSKAGSVVGFMLEEYGDQAFRNFLANFNTGQGTEASLQGAYGFGVDELDQRWSGSSAQNSSTSSDGKPFPFSSLSGILLSMMALLVVAVVIYRYVGDRLGWRETGIDPWDRLSDEEWDGRP